tara:strand:+ start:355 stop:474 length:120 start_codon:yes stop_codon:yes gene_type:complete
MEIKQNWFGKPITQEQEGKYLINKKSIERYYKDLRRMQK